VAACWCGDPSRGEAALAPLRSFGTVLDDSLRTMPYLDMQRLLSPPPIRLATYARSSFLRALDDAAIDATVAYAGNLPPAFGLFFFEHLHGAATRARGTAFSHRDAGFNFAALASWFEPPHADGSSAWVRGFSDALSPFFASGVYSNYLADGEDARVRAAYGSAYPRLLAVKRAYDPTNVFRLNQNIDPVGA
jgi:FAD/FMN-containing dehydrogenase